MGGELAVSVSEAAGTKCPRCWKHSTQADENGLCPRCASVIAKCADFGAVSYTHLDVYKRQGQYFALLPMILCMIAGGAVGYYAASMLLAKTPRVFKTTWRECWRWRWAARPCAAP